MNGILLLGARSEIGGELLTRLCADRPVVLAARGIHHDSIPQLPGAQAVHLLDFDASDFDSHRALVLQAQELSGGLSTAIVAFGILGEQSRAEQDHFHAVEIATVDYTAQISLLSILADELLQAAKPAEIIAFSSIAGWRARRANYVYGSTKAGLDAFCQGLADRLHGTAVRLITARPGFVIGRMTQGMTPAPLSSTPSQVADAIAAEIARGHRSQKPSSVTLWIPRRLAALAAIMRLIPRPLWRKMPR